MTTSKSNSEPNRRREAVSEPTSETPASPAGPELGPSREQPSAVRGEESADAPSWRAADWLTPGTIVGERFLIREVLGRGGFGLVLLAEDFITHQVLALKTPLIHVVGDDAEWSLEKGVGFAERSDLFLKEVGRWLQLEPHPNLVTAWELFEDRKRPFVAVQYVEGGQSLGRLIEAGQTDWRTALACGDQISAALHYAWVQVQLVHRDIKPDNILVSRPGEFLLTDFGLSLLLGTEKRGVSLAGSPAYMAPELWTDPKASPILADVYALGMTLYETCAGRLRTMDSATDAAHELEGMGTGIPREFAAWIGQCLDGQPERRPASYEIAARRLRELAAAHGVTQPASRPPDAKARLRWLVHRSESFARLGEPEAALKNARQALQLDARDLGALHAAANAQGLLGHSWRARWHLWKARRQAPDNFVIAGNTANLHYQRGKHASARRWLERTIALVLQKTGRLGWLQWYTDMIVDLLPPAQALELCRGIVADAPHAAVAWNNLAILLRRQGDFLGAAEAAQRALAINPSYAKAWVNYANALAHMRRFAETLDAATRAINLNAYLPGAYVARATALVQLGRIADAKETLEAGLRCLPRHPLLVHALNVLPGPNG